MKEILGEEMWIGQGIKKRRKGNETVRDGKEEGRTEESTVRKKR